MSDTTGVRTTTIDPGRRGRVGAILTLAAVLISTPTFAQPAAPTPETHVTIPYLANTASADIEFAAAECDIAHEGLDMTCRFRQVFITRASFDATACVITSNGYDQQFHRDAPAQWTSATTPNGDCGVVDTTVLADGGGTRWTITITSKATRGLERGECRRVSDTPPVVYSWRDVRRPLTCATIQPGSIER